MAAVIGKKRESIATSLGEKNIGSLFGFSFFIVNLYQSHSLDVRLQISGMT